MNKKEKVQFFDKNLSSIFKSKSNELISFIGEVIDNENVATELKRWPSSIKVLVVDKFLSFLKKQEENSPGK